MITLEENNMFYNSKCYYCTEMSVIKEVLVLQLVLLNTTVACQPFFGEANAP